MSVLSGIARVWPSGRRPNTKKLLAMHWCVALVQLYKTQSNTIVYITAGGKGVNCIPTTKKESI